jgi:HTH-type transcriptional regulator/antitoxin HigA
MHELGHVFLHLVNNNTAEFIEIETADSDYKNSKEELEANDFARNALINKDAWQLFYNENPFFDEAAAVSFANKQKVHPAVVQGRYIFETENYGVRSGIKKTLG